MLKGLLVDVEGTLSTVEIEETTTLTRLRGVREAIGCDYVDVIHLGEGIDCWVDDEGLYNSVFNPVLTGMTGRTRHTSPLLGAGLFLGGVQATGGTVSLTPEQIATVTRWWIGAAVPAVVAAL
jgi:hypothetical protein